MKTKTANRMSVRKRMILMAMGLGLFYWIVGSAADAFIFRQGNLIEEIFTLHTHEIWMRSLVLCTLILFSIYAQCIISERKKAEEALCKSEAKHRSLVEQSLQGFAVLQDYHIVFANNKVAEITGYSIQELQSLDAEKVKSIIHPDDRTATWERFRDRLAGKTVPSRYEIRVIRKDGATRWVEVLVSRIEYMEKPAIQAAVMDITERRQAAEELKNAKLEKEIILDSLVEHVIHHDREMRILWANRAACESAGLSREELIGRHCYEIWPQRNEPCEDCPVLKAEETGQAQEVEKTTPNGRLWFIRGYPVQNADGEVVGGIEVTLEVTERKRAERAIRETNARLETLIQAIPDIVYVKDVQGRNVLVNKAYEKLAGRQQADIVGKPDDQVLPPDLVAQCRYSDEEVMRERQPIRCEEKFTGENGDGVFFETIKAPLYDDHGNAMGLVGVSRDITERKQAEEALRESEEKFRSLAERSPSMNFINKKGKIVYANRRCEEVMGYTREELQSPGFNFIDLIAPESKELVEENFSKHMRGEEVGPYEYSIITKEGKRIQAILSSKLITYGGENAILGIVTDITERKRAEEHLKKAKEEAEEANRLKSEFLANMSHEIRTPMNAVIGMTDITLDTELTEEQRDYLTTVKQSARALLELLNDILDLSKIEADKIELEAIDFDLRVTVEGVAETLAPKASDKGLELACMIHHQVPSLLLGDPGRLRQVLMNLVGNAIKFTDKGEVVIAVELEEETEDRASLILSVTDTGVGIPNDKQEEIFQSFTQGDGSTTRRYGGTGLGLSICKRLVGLMGGEIGVESEPGKGSRFWFKVALEKQKETQADLPVVCPDIRGMRMLVVDDNQTNRTILVKMLESFGCSPEATGSGAEAIEALKRAAHKEKLFDLVFLDMQMPDMDGMETLRAIKDDLEIKDVVVVMLTSLGVRGDVARLEPLGCAGYLLKPIKQSQLFDTIITILSQRKAAAADRPARMVTRHTLAEQKRRRSRILLAEDNPMNQKLAVALLKKAGYTVHAVENGRLAVEALNRTPYDLVLMDVQMPEMDGFEATKAIRERNDDRRSTPIVAMTAHAMKGDRERCLGAGMDDYIAKPIEPQELLEAIKKWVMSDDPHKADAPPERSGEGGPLKDAPIDLEDVLSNRFDGDKDFLTEILREFLDYAPKKLKVLQEAAEEGHAEVVEREAHSLKGAAGNLGAKRLADLSLSLELAGRAKDLAGKAEMINDLRTEFERLEEFVRGSVKFDIALKS